MEIVTPNREKEDLSIPRYSINVGVIENLIQDVTEHTNETKIGVLNKR